MVFNLHLMIFLFQSVRHFGYKMHPSIIACYPSTGHIVWHTVHIFCLPVKYVDHMESILYGPGQSILESSAEHYLVVVFQEQNEQK